MNRYLQTVKAELLSDGGEIFDRFREMFGEERTELENLCAHAGQALEYAFDFMEGTFGSSQGDGGVYHGTQLQRPGSAVLTGE